MFINQFPEELIIHILSRLIHLADLQAANLTCRLWHDILTDENYPWKQAYETIWKTVPYQRIHPDSWKREYVERWREWRRWQYKHPSLDVTLNLDIGPLSSLHPSTAATATLNSLDNNEIKVNVVSLETGLVKGCRIGAHGGKAFKEVVHCTPPDGLSLVPTCLNLDLPDRIICGFPNGSLSIQYCLAAGNLSNARSVGLVHRHASTAAILFIKTGGGKKRFFVSVDSEGFFVLWRWPEPAAAATTVIDFAVQGKRTRPTAVAFAPKALVVIGHQDGCISTTSFTRRQADPPDSIDPESVKHVNQSIFPESLAVSVLDLQCRGKSKCWYLFAASCCSEAARDASDSDDVEAARRSLVVLKWTSSDSGWAEQWTLKLSNPISNFKYHPIDDLNFLLVVADCMGSVSLHHYRQDEYEKSGFRLECSKPFHGLQARVNVICIDEYQLSAADDSGEIRVWDICNGTTLKSLNTYSLPKKNSISGGNGGNIRNILTSAQNTRVQQLYCSQGQILVISGHIIRYWRFGPPEADPGILTHGRGSSSGKKSHLRNGRRANNLDDSQAANTVFVDKHHAAREMKKQMRAYREDEKQKGLEERAWDSRAGKANGAGKRMGDMTESEMVQYAMMLSMEETDQVDNQVGQVVDSDADFALALSIAQEEQEEDDD